VVAQRAGDIVTRRGQPHVYQPLLADRPRRLLAGRRADGDRRLDRQVAGADATLSNTCAVFPHSNTRAGPAGRLRLGVVAALCLLPAPGQVFLGSVDFM
jgi:hypothetical protein